MQLWHDVCYPIEQRERGARGVGDTRMRTRYQTNPKIAVFGMILSLGLIFGAQEVMSATKTTQESEEHEASLVAPLGIGMVNAAPIEMEEEPAQKRC